MGAWSPESPTYHSPSGDQNFEHEGAKMGSKTYDPQADFQWTNIKIPWSFCTFEVKTENI